MRIQQVDISEIIYEKKDFTDRGAVFVGNRLRPKNRSVYFVSAIQQCC